MAYQSLQETMLQGGSVPCELTTVINFSPFILQLVNTVTVMAYQSLQETMLQGDSLPWGLTTMINFSCFILQLVNTVTVMAYQSLQGTMLQGDSLPWGLTTMINFSCFILQLVNTVMVMAYRSLQETVLQGGSVPWELTPTNQRNMSIHPQPTAPTTPAPCTPWMTLVAYVNLVCTLIRTFKWHDKYIVLYAAVHDMQVCQTATYI